MKIVETDLPGVVLVELKSFADSRGYFMETWSRDRYAEFGLSEPFVQDNVSFSAKGVLRGLHFQHPRGQGKLVQVLSGEVYDVAVDIRPDSPSFGRWTGQTLSDQNRLQVYVPAGFAHGFCVLSDSALFVYKCTEFYDPKTEGGVLWNDPDLGIRWPVEHPLVSDKDSRFPRLKDIPFDSLPKRG
ncbi:MAG: dTDP-4-dehydrorhamnose 3,5-epimerase [Acidobacteriota bacterium]|nr:dTDP-4-dehydrorhamnose 3,5-epimerase [Acidobacteriota bacterium]